MDGGTELVSREKPTATKITENGPSEQERWICFSAPLFLCVNVISSVVFLVAVDEPVFDDRNNLPDVTRYAEEGVSVDTLRRHINPTGPGSFIWMASAGWAFGCELWVYRLAIVSSWVILGLFVLSFERHAQTGGLACCGLLSAAVFPHAATATATILTEGPALLLAYSGSLLWVHGVSRPRIDNRTGPVVVLGGLLCGLAVVCRQYYLALLPAMGVLALLLALRDRQRSSSWWVAVTTSGFVAAIPVAVMYAVFGGLSSPGMASGASYDTWRSGIGLNLLRPGISLLYVALYLVPFTFPAVLLLNRRRRAISTCAACLAAVLCVAVGTDLLQWGPVRSVALAAGRLPFGREGALAFIGFIAVFNFSNLVAAFGMQARPTTQSVYVEFSLLVLLFFVVEQIGVGGNIQFYERYVLQVMPFVGIVAFGIVRDFKGTRLSIASIMLLVSNVMLWRYA